MQKQLIVLIVVGMMASSAFAVKSSPSNEVGFWELNIQRGYNLVSFPVLPDNKDVDEVIGTQLIGAATEEEADRIAWYNPESGDFLTAWLNSESGMWEGELQELSEIKGYWIFVPDNHPETQAVKIVGNVFEGSEADLGAMHPGYNLVGNPYAANIPVEQAGMMESGMEGGDFLFSSDILLEFDQEELKYNLIYLDTEGNYQAGFETLEPDKGYWVYVHPNHEGFQWTMAFPAGEEERIMMPRSSQGELQVNTPILPWSKSGKPTDSRTVRKANQSERRGK
jgi:hypothetical protein